MSNIELTAKLNSYQQRIELVLDKNLPPADSVPARLHQAMRYSVLDGGKRVRPCLIYLTADALGIELDRVDDFACAVELIHSYSLIHDDLPAMDDDDLRRGKPSCHKAFDEATAILAGDTLQSLAFEILAAQTKSTSPISAPQALQQIKLLSQAIGSLGMGGGQMLDLIAEANTLTVDELRQIHILKTAKLFECCVLGVVCLRSDLTSPDVTKFSEFAINLGLAFQIKDDILDVNTATEVLGKPQGSDREQGKKTYVDLYTAVELDSLLTKLIVNAKGCLINLESAIEKNNANQGLFCFVDYLLTRNA